LLLLIKELKITCQLLPGYARMTGMQVEGMGKIIRKKEFCHFCAVCNSNIKEENSKCHHKKYKHRGEPGVQNLRRPGKVPS
jgi:hypothetical protein